MFSLTESKDKKVLNIKPPDYQFCPFCGKKLKIRIEEEHERKFCGSCNWTYYPHVAASVEAIIIKGSKVLMVRRNRDPYKGTWMLPAGFVDFGEHPEDTLSREIREETGLRLKKSKLLLIFQTGDDPRSPGHFCIFYRVAVSGTKLRTDEEENQEIGWFDLRHPPKIGWESHRFVIKFLQKG